MTEDFLQYLWRYSLFINDYNDVEIIETGQYNTDSGPDFFNAKIKINDTVWAGNVEIHKESSDWYLHNHHKNDAYNNVILHIVAENNKEIYTKNGRKIPQIELKFDNKLLENYNKILNSKHKIKCENDIKNVNRFDILSWLDYLVVERLEHKSEEIYAVLRKTLNNFEESFYVLLLKYFGLKINKEPFEQLAFSVPVKFLQKERNSLTVIESILFGQAGFLSDDYDNGYFNKLKKEYKFFKAKYNLQEINKHEWKFSKIRPSGFPTIRIAQIAELIFKKQNLFSKILELEKIQDFINFFDISATGYWENHYKFGKSTTRKTGKLGKQTIELIVINVIVPILFVYGKEKNEEKFTNRALELLQNLKPEQNSLIKYWEKTGLSPQNASESQALIELFNNYCNKNNCINCRIGNKLISNPSQY